MVTTAAPMLLTYRCRTSRADPPRSSCAKISTDRKVYRLRQPHPTMKGRARADGVSAKVRVSLWFCVADEQQQKINHSSDINLTNLKALEVSCDDCFAIRRKMLQIATQVPVHRQEIIIHPARNHPHTIIDVWLFINVWLPHPNRARLAERMCTKRTTISSRSLAPATTRLAAQTRNIYVPFARPDIIHPLIGACGRMGVHAWYVDILMWIYLPARQNGYTFLHQSYLQRGRRVSTAAAGRPSDGCR